ncbi:MAG: 50S ribosomal protein L29 [Planctomycetota bacterium]
MKNKDLREKDDQALNQLLVETQRKLFDLRQQSVTEKVEDTSQFKKGKRQIARIKTLLHERKLSNSAS